jgi:hypothetical protein
MEITSKHNIGDTVYVPMIGGKLRVGRGSTFGHPTIETYKIDSFKVLSDSGEIIYFFVGTAESNYREERYVFKDMKDAKKYALSMAKDIYEKAKEHIGSF